MTIIEIHTSTFTETMETLESLSSNYNFVFRGHSQRDWKICSSLSRFRPRPYRDGDNFIDEMLSHFLSSLASVGHLPAWRMDRRGRLEYGRHYGVPSPLIDFTLSPYVALFFAFNGIRPAPGLDDEVVVNALNVHALALGWAQAGGSFVQTRFEDFLYQTKPLFEDGYPANTLKFIAYPASWNHRMQRQMGVFIYDTLNYSLLGRADFEDLINSISETPDPNGGHIHYTMTKIFIPISVARNVFERLELMGMTGVRLMDDHVGAAADVHNAYNYPRRTGYPWDLQIPPPKTA